MASRLLRGDLAKSYFTLVIPSQLHRRGICLLPAEKQQIPRAKHRASVKSLPGFPTGTGAVFSIARPCRRNRYTVSRLNFQRRWRTIEDIWTVDYRIPFGGQ